MAKTSAALLCFLLLSQSAWADFRGRVVGVADGDTLTVLAGGLGRKVRLAGVDAPEKAQPFGARSKRSLAGVCAGTEAEVSETGKDRYGRTVGTVYCGGADANAEQVRRGMAWAYGRYLPRDSPLFALEAGARSAGRGLWADPDPVPPWEFRKAARGGRHSR